MYWTLFWQTGIEFGEQSHPLLEVWNRTWWELLRLPDAARVKTALDGHLPKSTMVVAAKAGLSPG